MVSIQIEISILQPIGKVWNYFNEPKHIIQWNFAHKSWHCPSAENNLEVGGKLKTRMEAKDGSFGFDLIGIYDEIIPNQLLKYHLEDGRKVEVQFMKIEENSTNIVQQFEPEPVNPIEMQRDDWLAILENFKKYSEQNLDKIDE